MFSESLKEWILVNFLFYCYFRSKYEANEVVESNFECIDKDKDTDNFFIRRKGCWSEYCREDFNRG